MKATINLYEFRDAFARMERADAFSYEGLNVLFKGLEEFEEDTNEEIELDVISLCCDYCEMSLSEMIDAYKHMIDEDILKNDDTNAIIDWFYNQTWVLGQTDIDTYVFRQF